MLGWRELSVQMYLGKLGERGWKKARASLLKELGTDLNESELRK